MSAGNAPKGDTDVNETVAPSTTTEEVNATESPENALDAEDLKELDGQAVPYQRFREVNEKAKSFEKKFSNAENNYQDQLRNLTQQYEAKLAAHTSVGKRDDDYSLDYEDGDTKQMRVLQDTIGKLTSDLTSLKTTQERQALTSQLKSLGSKYPKANELAVQGWAMAYPEASVEELMEKSHNDNVNMIKNSLNELIEKKKARQKKAVPIGSPRIVIKEEDRPKNFEEASKMAKKFLDSH